MAEDRDFDAMLDTLGDKAENLKIAAQLKGIEAHDAVKAKLADAQGDLAAATEQARVEADEQRSHVSAKLLQASMALRQKKDELAAEIDLKKAEGEQQHAAREAEAAAEYADYAVRYAMMSLDEARAAVLDAADKRMDYEERYGA